jgi:hypothetical protein
VFRRGALIRQSESVLDLHGAIQCVDHAGEFRQHAIAGGASDPAIMRSDKIVDDEAMTRQGGKRCHLVLLHMPAIPFDIGGEDGN